MDICGANPLCKLHSPSSKRCRSFRSLSALEDGVPGEKVCLSRTYCQRSGFELLDYRRLRPASRAYCCGAVRGCGTTIATIIRTPLQLAGTSFQLLVGVPHVWDLADSRDRRQHSAALSSVAISSARCVGRDLERASLKIYWTYPVDGGIGAHGMSVGLFATADTESSVAASTAPLVGVRSASRLRHRLALVAVCLLGVALVSRGIRDEGAGSLDGDMPRYLMNGAFLYDLIGDAPVRALLAYAQQYYARYPALSLGHHPFMPALAEAPFFFIFGVSVFSARLTTVCAFALLLVFWFRLIREIYDAPTAMFASLLLISTPGMIPLFQVVLSEQYTLCLIVLSAYFMHRYCVTERTGAAIAFAICVVLSAYAKQLAVFIFPVYLFQFVSAFGVRRLFRRSTLVTIAVMGCCLLPLVPLTLKYSHWNVKIVTQFVIPGDRTSRERLLRFARGFWAGQFRLSVPVVVLSGIALTGAALSKDRRILLFAIWAASVFVGLMLLGMPKSRFSCYWLPAFCALAASTVQLRSAPRWRAAWALILIATVGYQFWIGTRDAATLTAGEIRPAGATGYEEAARYVSDYRQGDTVLYSAAIDTGYFVFFVRKNDPEDRKS